MLEATDRLINLCGGLPAVDDPETFAAGVAAILSQYPDEVVKAATSPLGIPIRGGLRDLTQVKAVCDELYEPIQRQLERDRIANQPKLLERQPRTPEQQAEVDEQIARWRRGKR